MSDATALIALGGSSLFIAAVAFFAYRGGKKSAHAETTEQNLKAKDAMLEKAVNRPSDSDLDDRLRGGSF